MPTHFFGDSWEFPHVLTIEKTYKWFLFWKRKKVEQVNYTVSMFHDLRTFYNHWDKLIELKANINRMYEKG